MIRLIGFVIILLGIIGCTHSSVPITVDENAKKLSVAITDLSDSVTSEDAALASELLLSATTELAQEYQMESPAKYHNMLVKLGLRNRGLCCHWAEDLHAKLRKIDPQSIKFDWVVARHGSQLREHNSVVVYAANSNWQQGLVFDPWRKAGQPYWVRIDQDSYPWRPHPLSGQWGQLQCK